MVEDLYGATLLALLERALAANRDRIETLACRISEAVAADNVVHAFGSGHSSAVAFELFSRAGGLAAVNLLANQALSPFAGRQSGQLERVAGVAATLCAGHTIRPGDVGIVASNSGHNAVPIEVARILKVNGAFVVAVMSLSHSGALGHGGLAAEADLVLDTGVPAGDVLLVSEPTGFGPASTIVASVLLNCATAAAIARMRAGGVVDCVFRSQNLPGGIEHNEVLRARYRSRVRLF